MQGGGIVTWDSRVHIRLIRRQLIGWLLLWPAVIGYRPSYALIPGGVCMCVVINTLSNQVIQ